MKKATHYVPALSHAAGGVVLAMTPVIARRLRGNRASSVHAVPAHAREYGRALCCKGPSLGTDGWTDPVDEPITCRGCLARLQGRRARHD